MRDKLLNNNVITGRINGAIKMKIKNNSKFLHIYFKKLVSYL